MAPGADRFVGCRILFADCHKGSRFGRGRVGHLAGALTLRDPAHRVEAGAEKRRHLAPICRRAGAAANPRDRISERRHKGVEIFCRHLQIEGEEAGRGRDGFADAVVGGRERAFDEVERILGRVHLCFLLLEKKNPARRPGRSINFVHNETARRREKIHHGGTEGTNRLRRTGRMLLIASPWAFSPRT